MFCNWTVSYAPETVTIDPERGSEPGVRFRTVSDWGDDFEVLTVEKNGYSALAEWCRAADDGAVPDYFCDFLIDLTEYAINNNHSGSQGYQVDLAPNRVGLETARQRWLSEHP